MSARAPQFFARVCASAELLPCVTAQGHQGAGGAFMWVLHVSPVWWHEAEALQEGPWGRELWGDRVLGPRFWGMLVWDGLELSDGGTPSYPIDRCSRDNAAAYGLR